MDAIGERGKPRHEFQDEGMLDEEAARGGKSRCCPMKRVEPLLREDQTRKEREHSCSDSGISIF